MDAEGVRHRREEHNFRSDQFIHMVHLPAVTIQVLAQTSGSGWLAKPELHGGLQ